MYEDKLKADAIKFAENNYYGLDEFDEGGYVGINTRALADILIEFHKEQSKQTHSEEVYTIQQISDLFIPVGKDGYIDSYLDYRLFDKEQPKLNFKEWFEKFKKK